MKLSSSNDYDVVVIGSGVGGLVCASKLAKEGFRVGVFEQHYKPGGYCTDFSRKKFRFDAAVHFMGGCELGGVIGNILSDLNLLSDIKFKPVDPIIRVVSQDEEFRLRGNLKEFIQELQFSFPAECDRLDDFSLLIQNAWEETAVLLEASAEKIFSLSIKSRYISRIINQSFQSILDEYFSSPKLKSLLSLFCTYGGLPPNRMSGMYMMAILGSYLCQGTYYPIGGSQEFADTLVRGLIRFGGSLHLRKNVSKILLSNNRAIGIKLETGEEITAGCIVANVDAFHLFNELIGLNNLPGRLLKQLGGLEISMSAFQVFLGVELDLSSLGVSESEIIISNNLDFGDNNDLLENNLYLKGGVGITIPSILDPSSAPPNHHSMCLSLPVSSNSPINWRAIKNDLADSLINQAEFFLPDLRNKIIIRSVATPYTLQRYTKNFGGSCYGWAQTPEQSGTRRLKRQTGIDGLFLTGHWTMPGGGILAVANSGMKTAENIILLERS